jgi:hypothetical protein
VNHSFGWFLVEDVREFTCSLEFLLVIVGYIEEKNGQGVVVVVVCIWDRDAPEGELISGNVIESGHLLGLDCALEMIHCLRLVDFDREGI